MASLFPLLSSLLDCHKEIKDRLKELGNDVYDLKDEYGVPVLVYTIRTSVSKNTLQYVRYLLYAGADINAEDSHGINALTEATLYRRKGLISLLLDHGAVMQERTLSSNMRYMDLNTRYTLLERGFNWTCFITKKDLVRTVQLNQYPAHRINQLVQMLYAEYEDIVNDTKDPCILKKMDTNPRSAGLLSPLTNLNLVPYCQLWDAVHVFLHGHYPKGHELYEESRRRYGGQGFFDIPQRYLFDKDAIPLEGLRLVLNKIYEGQKHHYLFREKDQGRLQDDAKDNVT